MAKRPGEILQNRGRYYLRGGLGGKKKVIGVTKFIKFIGPGGYFAGQSTFASYRCIRGNTEIKSFKKYLIPTMIFRVQIHIITIVRRERKTEDDNSR